MNLRTFIIQIKINLNLTTMNLKDPIEIIYLIRTLLDESIDEAIKTDHLEKEVEDAYEFWKESIVRVYKQIDNKLLLLDIALTNLKIENEEYYYKLKDVLSELDNDIKKYYSQKEKIAPYPTLRPSIIKKHIIEMEKFHYNIKSDEFKQNESIEKFPIELIEEELIDEIILKTQSDRVRLLLELGIIEFLEAKYPSLKENKQKMSFLLMQFLNIKYNSIQPLVNALNLKESTKEKPTRKPKLTKEVLKVMEKYCDL